MINSCSLHFTLTKNAKNARVYMLSSFTEKWLLKKFYQLKDFLFYLHTHSLPASSNAITS